MQEECGEEELLTLSLGINSGWSQLDVSKKRKTSRPLKDHAHAEEDSFLGLLRSRDQMLVRQDPPKRHACGGGAEEDGKGLELIRSLLMAATAVDGSNPSSAVDSLIQLYQSVSLAGDPIQRVAAYFADGLAARLLLGSTLRRRRSSPLYERIVAACPTAEEELSAFTQLYQASPYYQFAHFTANQAIVEAFDKDQDNGRRRRRSSRLHVIDLDVSYGFQWPSLIQSLSDQAAATAKPVSLRITGVGPNVDRLKQTETRLTNFAKSYCCRGSSSSNLSFKFDSLLIEPSSPRCDFKIDESETLVVNSAFYLQSLRNSAEITSTLRRIHSLDPSVVVLVEREAGIVPPTFSSRFVESFHYFAAMFDSLDGCLPADSAERLSIERDHLGKEIKNAVVSTARGGGGDKELLEKKDSSSYKLESLKERMECNHFQGVKLSQRSVSQAKLLLKMKSHCSDHGSGGGGGAGGFRVVGRDDGGGLSLGWQDRHLITASAWRCAL